MSRRRRRSARTRSGSGRPAPVADVAWILGVCALGVALGSRVGPRFSMPVPIDRGAWHVVSPGLDESIQDPALGRGVYVEDGALTLRQHAFHRAEILSPRARTPVTRAEVDVLSGEVRLNFRSNTGNTFATLGAEEATAARDGGTVVSRPDGEVWSVEVVDGEAVLDTSGGPVSLGPAAEGRVELTAVSDEARLGRVAFTSADGRAVLVESYADTRLEPVHLVWGAVVGLLLGIATRASFRGGRGGPARVVEAALLLLPTAVVCAIPSAWWLFAVERMYLVRTPAWGLSQLCLALSLLPAASLGLLRAGVLVPPDLRAPRGVGGRHLWLGASVLVSVVAAIQTGLSVGTVLVSVVGLGFLTMPLRIAKEARLEPTGALVVDAPAHLAVALGGWGPGLLVALAWRMLTLMAAVGAGLLRQAPRPVTDLLFVMLLLAPVSVELSLRSTYLDHGWDMARLSGDLAPSVGWRDPRPFWVGECGDSTTSRYHRVIWMGGSSTGGAYQFRSEPSAFYPAQAHQRVCDSAQSGVAVRIRSENYGDGGRDTFTVSRSLTDIADRDALDLVVVYTGVNDVMTMSGTRSRAQREAEQAERDAAMTGLAGVGARSRLLTGLSLLVRPLHAVDGPRVPEVPLPDAEDNFETVARVAAERGAKVLLLTEVVRSEGAGQLEAYRTMQAQVADRHEHVTYLDLRQLLAAQGPWDDQEMLVDQNHLSRPGSARVAAAIAPTLARLLDLEMTGDPSELEMIPADRISTVQASGTGAR